MMLNIQIFVCNMLQENCYVVSDETRECILIDCGAFFNSEREEIVRYITENKLTSKHLVATHAHIDHNMGNNTIYDVFGLQPEVLSADKMLMENLSRQAESLLGVSLDYELPPVETYLEATDTICFGNHTFTLIHTPGHTPGSACFYCREEGVMFSGDTLFQSSIGRVDLEGGSMFDMIQSIRLISQLPDQTKVFPGHGPQTTIGHELAHNPYMER